MTDTPVGGQAQRLLRLYHLYRLSIGLLLVLLISSDLDREWLPLAHVQLFTFGSWAYLIVNILAAVLLQQPRSLILFCLGVADVLLLSLLFYAGGGAPSGIGNLMIVAVAFANILVQGRLGLLVAAIASIGMIYLTFYLSLWLPGAGSQFVQVGALGALCFAVAMLVQALTRRLRLSESLAEQRADDVANLVALNEQILQRMRTGILVLDAQQQVVLGNQGARHLLGRQALVGLRLLDLSADLHERLLAWQINPTRQPQTLRGHVDGPLLQPSFIALTQGRRQDTLIFLEDAAYIAQHAQQLKLISLGRLTASIAHEIRNPLGAISHAAQLLGESEQLQGGDQRLAQIVQKQSQRMNLIIENVLQLSRRRPSERQLIDLEYWLRRFISEQNDSRLHLSVDGDRLHTHMDPHQLTQVLDNLVRNALRHSPSGQVWLRLRRDKDSHLVALEVEDDGPGVPLEHRAHLFEPFFTTDEQGTGLGLYISRELCDSNQAQLDYHQGQRGGCFRIVFAHPQKTT